MIDTASRTPARTRIKICGVTSPEIARAAVDAGADAIGLVFAPNSPRCIDAGIAMEITDDLPPFVTPIGLFQNATAEQIDRTWPWPWVQLHGDELPEMLTDLPERRIIRGFPFTPDAVRTWDECEDVAALLVDGSTGGAGQSFDHNAFLEVRSLLTKPLIIAGGLTSQNVGDAIDRLRPDAVDVSSGVESSRGIKEPHLIDDFCRAVREADARCARR